MQDDVPAGNVPAVVLHQSGHGGRMDAVDAQVRKTLLARLAVQIVREGLPFGDVVPPNHRVAKDERPARITVTMEYPGGSNMLRYVPFTLIGFVLALACVGVLEHAAYSGPDPVLPQEGDLDPEELRTVETVRKVSESVVFITNKKVAQGSLFGWFGSMDEAEIPQGSGSGFIWDTEGHVVTNYHVTRDADVLTVTLPNHTTWEAKVVGQAPSIDLAVRAQDDHQPFTTQQVTLDYIMARFGISLPAKQPYTVEKLEREEGLTPPE